VAIGDAYADNTRYKAIIGKSTGDNDSEIDAQLLAVSRLVERDCLGGRYLTKDATVTIRRYPGVYSRTLNVEDIASTAGLVVKVDDNRDGTAETTLTVVTDYELYPLNALTGPESRPYTQLVLPDRASRFYWPNLIEVTAIHGWPAVPEAIAQGVCQLVALLRLEGPRATSVISEDMSAVIGVAPKAQSIVDKLIDAYAKPAWVYSNA
jgi:hypothetical protein